VQPIPFPHHADSANRLLIWTPDQIIPVSCMFIIGLLTDTLSISIVIGLILSWAYTRYSSGKPDGFLLHAAYWYGMLPLPARSAINPFNRRILPK